MYRSKESGGQTLKGNQAAAQDGKEQEPWQADETYSGAFDFLKSKARSIRDLAHDDDRLTAQTFNTLHNFDGTDGGRPSAALVQLGGGNYYGTTYTGETKGQWADGFRDHSIRRSGDAVQLLLPTRLGKWQLGDVHVTQ